MVYDVQNYLVSGLCPSVGIRNTRKHNTPDLFPPSSEGEETSTLLGPLEELTTSTGQPASVKSELS
jgi:hypothetical protein